MTETVTEAELEAALQTYCAAIGLARSGVKPGHIVGIRAILAMTRASQPVDTARQSAILLVLKLVDELGDWEPHLLEQLRATPEAKRLAALLSLANPQDAATKSGTRL